MVPLILGTSIFGLGFGVRPLGLVSLCLRQVQGGSSSMLRISGDSDLGVSSLRGLRCRGLGFRGLGFRGLWFSGLRV